LWTYTTYILWKYFEKHPEKKRLKFNELATLMFDKLFREKKVVFHDGIKDLYDDLIYLKGLGVLDFEETEGFEKIEITIKDEEKLNEIAKVVKNSPFVEKIDLLKEYLRRIDEGVK
jgi:hypothetical protein